MQTLDEFVRASKKNRQMSYQQLSTVLFSGQFTEGVIRSSLYRMGHKKYVANPKPPISEESRVLRLA